MISFLATTLNRIRIRFNNDRLSMRDYTELRLSLQPGDIILTRQDGKLTNALVPGEHTHVFMFIGKGSSTSDLRCIEATWPVVRIVNLLDVVMSVDRIVSLRIPEASTEDVIRAVSYAKSKIGVPYDEVFKTGAKRLYCSELVALAYRDACNREVFNKRRVGPLLRKVYVPDDLALDARAMVTVRRKQV